MSAGVSRRQVELGVEKKKTGFFCLKSETVAVKQTSCKKNAKRETEQEFYAGMKEKKKKQEEEEERKKIESGRDGYRAFLSVERESGTASPQANRNIKRPPPLFEKRKTNSPIRAPPQHSSIN